MTSLAESLTAIEGVNATVTDKGDGTFSLIVNSDTGAKNALRLTVMKIVLTQALQLLIHLVIMLKQVVAASDAAININGVTVSRTTNVVTDLIDGYEFS